MTPHSAKDFFDEIRRINNDPDLRSVVAAVKNENLYKDEIIENLFEVCASVKGDIRSMSTTGMVEIGMIPEEPRPERVLMENHLKVEFLKRLEYIGFIENLHPSMENVPGGATTDNVLVATFSFIPERLKLGLGIEKEALLNEEAERKSAATSGKRKKLKPPHTSLKKDKGFLILNGHTIEIGTKKTIKFKLVSLICEFFNTYMTVDGLFNRIRLERHETDGRFSDDRRSLPEKARKIKEVLREINRPIRAYSKKRNLKLPTFAIKFSHKGTLIRFEQR